MTCVCLLLKIPEKLDQLLKINNLPRSIILKKRQTIVGLLSSGVRFDGRCIRLILHKLKSDDYGRVAFLVNKKLGRKAHLRVKIKRWLREIFRNNKSNLPLSNVIFSVRVPYLNLTYQDLYADFKSIVNSKEFADYCNKDISKTFITAEDQ